MATTPISEEEQKIFNEDYLKYLFLHDRDYSNPKNDSFNLRCAVCGIEATVRAQFKNVDAKQQVFVDNYCKAIKEAFESNKRPALFFLLLGGLCKITPLADYMRGRCPREKFDRFLVHLKQEMHKFKTGQNIDPPTPEEAALFESQANLAKYKEKERKKKQAEMIAKDRLMVFDPEPTTGKDEIKERPVRKGRGKKAAAKEQARLQAAEAEERAAEEERKAGYVKPAKDVRRTAMELKYRDIQHFVESMTVFYASGQYDNPHKFPLAVVRTTSS